jgi:signal transduction histidine kinase
MSPYARRVDAGLGLATAVVVGTAVTADVRGDGTAPIAYLFAAGFGALMLVRRSQPVLALVASGIGLLGYYAIGLPPIGLALPVGAALYSAAEAGRLRWAIGTAAALVAISSVARSLGGEDPGYLYAYELPTTIAVMAAAIVLGDGVRTRRLWRTEVSSRLAGEAEQRVQHERLALARDLHDVLAHTVSVVTLHADVAAEALADGDTAAAETAIGRVRKASGEAGRELRGTLTALRTAPAPPAASTTRVASAVSTAPVLARLGDLIADAPVDLTVEGEARSLPMVVDATAYRIIQEALTNVLRHAQATSATVGLRYARDALQVEVDDDGHRDNGVESASGRPSEDPDRQIRRSGHGLAVMAERAAAIGGHLEAGAKPAGGWRVHAWLPLGEDGP